MGSFEHFQKFHRFLILELVSEKLVKEETVAAFTAKCKTLFKTELKLEQNHI